ncbi:MAG: NADPH-dependent F420 reductase [Acidimicrobiales bacterium]
MRVGILGGTGPAGSALAVRLASVGVEVSIGSREAERGRLAAAELVERWPGRELSLTGVANEEACVSDLVVLAAPWEGAASLAASLAVPLRRKVVISMVNALERVGGEVQALVPVRGSMTLAVQCSLPESLVVGAFHHIPARALSRIDRPVEADVLVCSDHHEATSAAVELVDAIPGCKGIDAGTLSAAGAIEAFTAVLVGINIAQKAHASIRLTGLERRPDAKGDPA